MTGFVDVVIPLVAAVLLLANPEAMVRKDTPRELVPVKVAKMRKIGMLLLASLPSTRCSR